MRRCPVAPCPFCSRFAALAASSASGQTCVTFVSPQPQFAAYVGQAVNLQLQLSACGSVDSVSVLPDSEANNRIYLTNQGNGLWVGSWTPTVAGPVLLDAFAVNASGAVTFVDGKLTIGTQGGSVQQPSTLAPVSLTFSVQAGSPPSTQTLTITLSWIAPSPLPLG